VVNRDLAPVQFRLAGALLRHHREAARQTLEEAAAELGCDRSKISRIETGHRRPVLHEMQQLLAAYGVSDRERQAIAALTAETARAGWWSEYRGLLPDALVDHAMLESIACDAMVYAPQALPAFLQSCEYAAAVTAADPALQTGEERRLAALLAARRAASARDQDHAAFTIVIGEAVLMQQVGGGQAMRAQLGQLAGGARQLPARVTLQVVPFTAGAHPAIDSGPVSILRFRGVTGVGAICHGGSAARVSVARQAELTAAVRRFETLRDTALSPEESRKLIREVIATLL
jgi:transcriptional regulator with XRE-family HTH domain